MWMWVRMGVCLSMLACDWLTTRVCPASRPVAAGRGSSRLATLMWINERAWMDSYGSCTYGVTLMFKYGVHCGQTVNPCIPSACCIYICIFARGPEGCFIVPSSWGLISHCCLCLCSKQQLRDPSIFEAAGSCSTCSITQWESSMLM